MIHPSGDPAGLPSRAFRASCSVPWPRQRVFSLEKSTPTSQTREHHFESRSKPRTTHELSASPRAVTQTFGTTFFLKVIKSTDLETRTGDSI